LRARNRPGSGVAGVAARRRSAVLASAVAAVPSEHWGGAHAGLGFAVPAETPGPDRAMSVAQFDRLRASPVATVCPDQRESPWWR